MPEHLYNSCKICPRKCGVDRLNGKSGYCKTGSRIAVASVCLHMGEEPVLGGNVGVCNVFFSHCNLQCVYCQNFQISNNTSGSILLDDVELVADKICAILDTGVKYVGFVSASHQIVQMLCLIEEINSKGYNPMYIYNTNGYDLPESIDLIDPYIQIYLPDFKYSDAELSKLYSDAEDYVQVAQLAIKRMIYHKGVKLLFDENEQAVWGIIIRHLIIPGQMQNSKDVLQIIASISTKLHISIMSQYKPIESVMGISGINRTLLGGEYEKLINCAEELGFENYMIQAMDSPDSYNPNFNSTNPFS